VRSRLTVWFKILNLKPLPIPLDMFREGVGPILIFWHDGCAERLTAPKIGYYRGDGWEVDGEPVEDPAAWHPLPRQFP
jgi:hypothetical protein